MVLRNVLYVAVLALCGCSSQPDYRSESGDTYEVSSRLQHDALAKTNSWKRSRGDSRQLLIDLCRADFQFDVCDVYSQEIDTLPIWGYLVLKQTSGQADFHSELSTGSGFGANDCQVFGSLQNSEGKYVSDIRQDFDVSMVLDVWEKSQGDFMIGNQTPDSPLDANGNLMDFRIRKTGDQLETMQGRWHYCFPNGTGTVDEKFQFVGRLERLK